MKWYFEIADTKADKKEKPRMSVYIGSMVPNRSHTHIDNFLAATCKYSGHLVELPSTFFSQCCALNVQKLNEV